MQAMIDGKGLESIVGRRSAASLSSFVDIPLTGTGTHRVLPFLAASLRLMCEACDSFITFIRLSQRCLDWLYLSRFCHPSYH